VLWLINLGFAAGGTVEPPTPTPTPAPSVGAGRPRRRRTRPYVIRIDGKVFEAGSEAEALQIIGQAKLLAEKAAALKSDDVVERALPRARALGRVKPISIKAPSLTVSYELQHAAREAQAAIDRAYRNASAAAELRMLLAIAQEQEDDDLLLLL
jgi:hypothetical protein